MRTHLIPLLRIISLITALGILARFTFQEIKISNLQFQLDDARSKCVPLGVPPSITDKGISDEARQEVPVLGWSAGGWTFITNPVSPLSIENFFGEWIATDTNDSVCLMVFHKNGRLDRHYRSGQVTWTAYQFWHLKHQKGMQLLEMPWGPGELGIPNPADECAGPETIFTETISNQVHRLEMQFLLEGKLSSVYVKSK